MERNRLQMLARSLGVSLEESVPAGTGLDSADEQ